MPVLTINVRNHLSYLSRNINIKLGNQLSGKAVATYLPATDRQEILLQE